MKYKSTNFSTGEIPKPNILFLPIFSFVRISRWVGVFLGQPM